jgi:chaperonin GroEL
MNQGYSPKELQFGKDGRDKLISGISQLSNAVKSTLGPQGNTVLIESPEHVGGITVTKDGVTVAKSINLIDPTENLAVRMMKEAADRTASLAGDGTTTAIVLTEALVKAGTDYLATETNRTEVLRHLVDLTTSTVNTLKKKSKKLNKRKMRDVAVISANNDKQVGGIISDVYNKVGKDGIVTVEKSLSSSTYFETTMGIKVDKGYSTPLFINDQKRDECILEDVYILVSDAEVSNILQIENVLKPIIQDGKKLLLIAPTATNVINTLAANVMKNNLKICNIPPPNFGYKQHELMQDIAHTVGATYFSEKTGDDLSIINFTDLGHAAKVIVGRDSTVILKDEGDDVPDVSERVAELRVAYDNATKKHDKDFIMSRIASLTGGIGVIYVGGNTDLEQKELYDRVDDAVCAVRSALEEGILPGGGVALYNIHESYQELQMAEKNHSKKIAYAILNAALRAPIRQILFNAGYNLEDIYINDDIPEHVLCEDWEYGYDVKEETYGDMFEMGIIDPLKVTRSALQNAVSVAVTILSTNAIVTMARSYETK